MRGRWLVVCGLTLLALGRLAIAVDWAYEATFDADPQAPSQALLPTNMDFVVTHRTHPRDHLSADSLTFPADHGSNCSAPPMQHLVVSSHLSNAARPDQSFYVCKNHMMSALGDVSGYSVSAFYPRQEFDFAQGGMLEFRTDMNLDHPRFWWEVMIVPRAKLKVAAAEHFLPIDETYPSQSVVFSLSEDGQRKIQVHEGAIPPDGILLSETDWRDWRWLNSQLPATDPQFVDRKRRYLHRIEFAQDYLRWSVEKIDGTLDAFEVALAQPLSFDRGLVVFKTHAYTPEKEGNVDRYTVHWDDIRFSGPVVGRYDVIESSDLVYLQANGNRAVGESSAQVLQVPDSTNLNRPQVLFGQVHNPMRGQVLLSINGGPTRVVDPYEYEGGCRSSGWKSFRLALQNDELKHGDNELTWTIGPRPSCAESWVWNGFSIKGLELQLSLDEQTSGAPPNTHLVPLPGYLLALMVLALVAVARSVRRL